jgi:hypothetical protein
MIRASCPRGDSKPADRLGEALTRMHSDYICDARPYIGVYAQTGRATVRPVMVRLIRRLWESDAAWGMILRYVRIGPGTCRRARSRILESTL